MKLPAIIGISGQVRSRLAESLLENGHEVPGVIRRASSFNSNQIDHWYRLYREPHRDGVWPCVHTCDRADRSRPARLGRAVAPDEISNHCAQGKVMVSLGRGRGRRWGTC